MFEQIWAAEDFEIFKRIMVQRNIELELQALELIKQQQKQKENQKEKQTAVLHVDQQKLQQIEDEKNEKGIESYEESILQEVLRKSREEYEEAAKGKEKDSTDVEKHYRETHESNIKMYDSNVCFLLLFTIIMYYFIVTSFIFRKRDLAAV